MKMQLQKPLLFGLLLSLLPSCASDPTASDAWDHWSTSSVPPRIERFFLSYDPDRDGPYSEKIVRDVDHIRQLGNRMFLHKNDENPFQNNTRRPNTKILEQHPDSRAIRNKKSGT